MTDEVPFKSGTFPRSALEWIEAPLAMQELLQMQAVRNGTEIIRDREVRLTCDMPDGGALAFVVFWPAGEERMNMLAPKKGRAGRR